MTSALLSSPSLSLTQDNAKSLVNVFGVFGGHVTAGDIVAGLPAHKNDWATPVQFYEFGENDCCPFQAGVQSHDVHLAPKICDRCVIGIRKVPFSQRQFVAKCGSLTALSVDNAGARP